MDVPNFVPLDFDRRQFLKLAGIGGAVFASGLGDGFAKRAIAADGDFFFVQMSDSHWGFSGPKLNPEAATTLKTAVQRVNALTVKPDFIVFTGDLTHTTDDPKERRRRLAEFKSIVSDLTVKDLRFMPGEHDASLDNGEAYKEFFGAPYWSFDHKGVHFVAIDNVSDPGASIGDAQLAWLKADLAKFPADHPIVVFTHRPLFDLYPQWDWATRDGAKAVDIMMPYQNITVFYGHIHQEHHHMTGHIAHHAAMSLIFPQPPAGSLPKRDPVAWDPAVPYKGLGFRTVEQSKETGQPALTEQPLAEADMMTLRGMVALMVLTIGIGLAVGWRIGHPAAAAGPLKTISVFVQKFDFQPAEIRLKKGEPVVLELTSYDRLHGFNIPDLKLRVDVLPDQTVRVPLTPDTAGRFAFRCDVFCGDGHEDMEGVIIVEE